MKGISCGSRSLFFFPPFFHPNYEAVTPPSSTRTISLTPFGNVRERRLFLFPTQQQPEAATCKPSRHRLIPSLVCFAKQTPPHPSQPVLYLTMLQAEVLCLCHAKKRCPSFTVASRQISLAKDKKKIKKEEEILQKSSQDDSIKGLQYST